MAMRLADTFLVHRRSCFAILFSGQTPRWSLPRSFWTPQAADDSIGGPQMLKFLNALAALAAVGTFVIAFLDSYEVRFKVRRRTRGADGGRHLRRNKRK